MKKALLLCILLLVFSISLISCENKKNEKDGCDHKYDNACDDTCNKCEEEREVAGHDYSAATCTAPNTCKNCGKERGKALDHTPEEDDGDCTTEVKCSVCGETATPARDSHTRGDDDGDCTTEVKCVYCDEVVIEALASHTPAEDDGDCTTEVKCVYCDEVVIEAFASHTPAEDDGDCTTPLDCLTCYKDAVAARNEHTDSDIDGICDYCEHQFDYVIDEEKSTCYVFTADGLYYVSDELYDYNVILMNDIVLPTEPSFDLDGDGENDSNWSSFLRLYKTFDGNGYSIKGLKMHLGEKDHSGLFYKVEEGAVVKNLSLVDISIEAGYGAGGITSYNYGTIINCFVSGSINASSSSAGGIAGLNSEDGTIIACTSSVNITGVTEGAGAVGGIVGQFNAENGKIIGCCNTGNIISLGNTLGGITGVMYEGSTIASYNSGFVSDNMYCGAITGHGNDAVLTNTYWSVPEGSAANAHGYNDWKPSDDTVKAVDGETFTWTDAMNAMNGQLEELGYEWRFAINTGDDAATRPLVLVTVSAE